MRLKFFRLPIVFLFFFPLSSCSTESPTTPDIVTTTQKVIANCTYDSTEIETLNLINTYRKSIGLKSLEKINYISVKSEEHNNFIIANNVVNHDNFPTRTQNIIQTIGAIKVAENIAFNYSTAQGVLDAWLKSPGHKANIEGDFTHFGISIRSNAEGKKYITNIFVKK
jgi:uncharacterized protein YkwD